MDITKYIDERAPQPDRPHFTREKQPAGPVRSRQIYINHENDWILRALVKAQKKHHMDTPTTKEELADSVLTSYFDAEYPELRGLYKERQEIDNRAVTVASTRGPETAAEKSKP